jgi:hypothetical protein
MNSVSVFRWKLLSWAQSIELHPETGTDKGGGGGGGGGGGEDAFVMHNSFEMKLECHCFDLHFDIRVFVGLGDVGLFHWKLGIMIRGCTGRSKSPLQV